MNGSYWTTREPSQDCKFAKSSRVFQKETEPSLIFADQSYFTCLLWGLVLGYAGFYAGPTNDALEEAYSSRERGIWELWSGSPLLYLGCVKTGVFFIRKLRHWKVNVVEDAWSDNRRFLFLKQNTQSGTTISNVAWHQPTTPCVHSSPRGLGHTAHQ